eukprot:TRINITY_DN7944_c0_g1_i1.p3 TRINITY_DN7944_c0_g1~~TRINITY_DN7944_c0_g1_i1.p3  ORF type:complete len:100 (-),score=4.30 TRINITY_DN7944_c0_g1_i1:177-476(-)
MIQCLSSYNKLESGGVELKSEAFLFVLGVSEKLRNGYECGPSLTFRFFQVVILHQIFCGGGIGNQKYVMAIKSILQQQFGVQIRMSVSSLVSGFLFANH